MWEIAQHVNWQSCIKAHLARLFHAKHAKIIQAMLLAAAAKCISNANCQVHLDALVHS